MGTGEKDLLLSGSPKTYIAIDLKSFYASVECRERGLDPMTTNLVVADASRTEKTICLAVSPSLKSYGIPGRPRLFEVVQKVKGINRERKYALKGKDFSGESYVDTELRSNPSLKLGYITAVPRMKLYMQYSTQIYRIYLRYVSKEDIHVYSIDEVFIDAGGYLENYGITAHELCMRMIRDVLRETGITATAGIGTNMYLAKIAMDIVAKHAPADRDGVRIAELDELSYREQLWNHRPLTDFWRVGKGYARKLEARGLYTMGDIARCSIGKPTDFYNEELLYKDFGVNAQLLIDHAWGWEPCTIREIRSYQPENESMGAGQVLSCPYDAGKARIVVQEMADSLSLELVSHGVAADQIVLTIGYDVENLMDPERKKKYRGEITTDFYGRQVPKHAHGTENIGYTSSTRAIIDGTMRLYDRIINPGLLIRRISISANHIIPESEVEKKAEPVFEQMSLFVDYKAEEERKQKEKGDREKERRVQEAVLGLREKFGKNSIVKGLNLREGGTAMERNGQVGGHKA